MSFYRIHIIEWINTQTDRVTEIMIQKTNLYNLYGKYKLNTKINAVHYQREAVYERRGIQLNNILSIFINVWYLNAYTVN